MEKTNQTTSRASIETGETIKNCKNFEDLLKRYFGLKTKLLSGIPEEDEVKPDDAFTKEGWDSWGRYIDLVEDMKAIGLLDEEEGDRLIERVWDIVYED